MSATWTPRLRDRCLALRAEGLGYRTIATRLEAEGINVSHMTVATIIRTQAAADARKGEGEEEVPAERKARKGGRAWQGTVHVADQVPGQVQAPEVRPVELEALGSELPTLPEDASLSARLVYAELLEVRAATREVHQKVLDGEFPMSQWVSAKTHVLRLLKALSEMIPPPPPDPSKDPTNLACRDMTHAQVARLVRVAQRQVGQLCPACQAANYG